MNGARTSADIEAPPSVASASAAGVAVGPTLAEQRWAIAGLVAGAMAIAFSPIFAKLLIDRGNIGSTASAFWRVALATPMLFAAMAVMRRRRGAAAGRRHDGGGRWMPWRGAAVLLVPGLFFAGDLASWHASLRFTSVANATVIANFAAVIVAIIGYVFLRERYDWRFVLGTVLAMGGVVGLLLSGGDAASGFATDLAGDLLALAAAGFYAGYLLSIKIVRERFAVLPVMAYSSLAAAGVLLVAALLTGEPMVMTTAEGWAYALGLAVLCHVVGQGLIAWAMARLAASFSAVSLLLQPLAAAWWGWLILGQRLGAAQLAAGAVVIAGIALARTGSAKVRAAVAG